MGWKSWADGQRNDSGDGPFWKTTEDRDRSALLSLVRTGNLDVVPALGLGSDAWEHVRESNLIEDIDDPEADVNHEAAWALVRTQPRITLKAILAAHKLTTRGQLPSRESGRLREVSVLVGGRRCPPPGVVPRLLDEWITEMENWSELDPREMHVRFEKIHPFVDGNGRTGRLLMWWHEAKLGRPLTLLKADERDRYYTWFRDDAAYRYALLMGDLLDGSA